jgi:hypothetical protein
VDLQAPARKGLAKFAFEFDHAIDEFSSLPLWFSLPLILVASFAVGAIVSILL